MTNQWEVRIECEAAEMLPLTAIETFQGGLKKRTEEDIDNVIISIQKYGFSFPFLLWKNNGHNYCIDGHGRIEALTKIEANGIKLPLFPVSYIMAKDEKEAKQKLLRLNSAYGFMTEPGIKTFIGNDEILFDELSIPECAISFKGEFLIPEDAPQIELKPYNKIHILLSFHPDVFPKIIDILDNLRSIPEVEYEQSAN
jgi:hypothetical protein